MEGFGRWFASSNRLTPVERCIHYQDQGLDLDTSMYGVLRIGKIKGLEI